MSNAAPRVRAARMIRFAVVALLLASCGSAPMRHGARRPAPPRIPLAVTIDDVPYVGPLAPGRSREEAIDAILAAARAHDAPLTAFVTCRNAQEDGADLARWRGVELANHSFSHRALDDLGLDSWREDVSRCQARITELTGTAPRFFRYPFLRTGADRALRDRGLAVLDELALRRVPVSIDTSDWALARPYVRALQANDLSASDAVAAAYVDHVRRSARRYVELASQAGHPGAPQILLLHANALAADHLGALLSALEEDGFRFVSLEEAMRHPLYAREDRYAGAIGLSWLYRVTGTDGAWAWDAAQQHALSVASTERRSASASISIASCTSAASRPTPGSSRTTCRGPRTRSSLACPTGRSSWSTRRTPTRRRAR